MVEIAKALFRPNSGLQFFASDQVTWALKQNLEHLEGLLLKLDANSRFTNLSGVEICLKYPKPNRVGSIVHQGYSVPGKV
jgi:hypothetical protein